MESNYEILDSINSEHKIYLVKNIQDKQIYVKKVLDIYNLEVYKSLINLYIPGIPKIKELFKDENSLIVYEEYIPGLNIEEQLDNGKTFSESEILYVGVKLCEILSNLNKQIKIVHRDIKPSNIIINDKGLYLLDFNAAKFIEEDKQRDTVLLGTEGYAAPEQYGFGSSSIQTDIYAIGMLLKELSKSSTISDKLNKIIEKCTQIDPKNRYESFESLKSDLQRKVLKNEYLPIGFRTNNTSHKIIAIIIYLLVLLLCLSLETTTHDPSQTWAIRIAMFISFICIIFFNYNYLGIQESIGLNKLNSFIRKIVIIGCDFIILILMLFIAALILTIIESII